MNTRLKRAELILIGVLLTAGCSPVTPAPAQTTVPTRTEAPAPVLPTATFTMISPTETPAPTPTRTLLPPVETIRNIAYVPDGVNQQVLNLYLPPEGEGPFPTVLLIHGGGGCMLDLAGLATQLARQGYAAASMNFRDFPSYNYPAAVEDAFCSLGWLHANAATYQLDTQRFYALGHSMGGTLAAMLAVVDDTAIFMSDCPHTLPETNRIHGVVTYTGIFDYTSPSMTNALISYAGRYLGGTKAAIPEIWSQASPMTWLDGSEPPFLLIHGEADDNIPPEQSQAFAAALQATGVQNELLLIPEADHFDIIGSQVTLEAALEFLTALVGQ